MKKIISLFVSILLVLSMGIPVIADEVVAEPNKTNEVMDSSRGSTTYWFQLRETRSGNYYNTFSVMKNGILPIRRVYVNAGFKFADGVNRKVKLKVGDKTFEVVADGTVYQLGNWNVNTDIPVIISIENVPSTCSTVVTVYSID